MKQLLLNAFCVGMVCLGLGFVVSAQADPVTLTVTNWSMQGYYDEGTPSVRPFSFDVVNANGNKVTLSFLSLLTSPGPGGLGVIQSATGPSGQFDSKAFLEVLVPGSTANLAGSLSVSPVSGSFIGNLAQLLYSVSQTTATVSGNWAFFSGGQKVYDVSINLTGSGNTEKRPGGEIVTTAGGTTGKITVTPVDAQVPEPATLLLLGSGLAAMGARKRLKRWQ